MEKRVVRKNGSIVMEGRVYAHEDLIPFVGRTVQAFIDRSANEAFACCFDKKGEFITNARNEERWVEMRSWCKNVLKNS